MNRDYQFIIENRKEILEFYSRYLSGHMNEGACLDEAYEAYAEGRECVEIGSSYSVDKNPHTLEFRTLGVK